jgi:hypothetical protein
MLFFKTFFRFLKTISVSLWKGSRTDTSRLETRKEKVHVKEEKSSAGGRTYSLNILTFGIQHGSVEDSDKFCEVKIRTCCAIVGRLPRPERHVEEWIGA